MILIGELALWVALLMATWATAVSFAGGAQRRNDLVASGERAVNATLGMVLLASIGLWTALIAHDFSLAHVASFTSANLPLLYTLAAFWGGPAGALLLWTSLFAACSAAVVYRNRNRLRELMPHVTGTLAAVLAFSLALLCLGANPFDRLDWLPLDGRGMNPRLQSPAMALHPPVLYLGFASTAVPFALTVAALFTRRLDGGWLAAARRWVIVSWLCLTIGIVLGMWWAYVEPGPAGHWTRDGVENGSVFSWLIVSVLLLAIAARGRGGAARTWVVVLALAAFPLSLFAAFLMDGGVVSLAHSFGQSPTGKWFRGFLIVVVSVAGYLAVTRLRDLRGTATAGAGTRMRWWRASIASVRRSWSARIALAGIVIVLVALTGPAFANGHVVLLGPGESRELGDPFGRRWTFTSQGVSQYNELNRRVNAAAVEVLRDGRSRGIITSERRQYVNSRGNGIFRPATAAGIMGSGMQDIRVVLVSVDDDERALLRIGFHPLVAWVWIGGVIMAIGGAVALAETARREG
ncbi:hypothetical protein BH23GEM1_BH23GEM1_08270 [soil metagenome]